MSASLARALRRLARQGPAPDWPADVGRALRQAERWLLRVPADYLDGHDLIYLFLLAAAIRREIPCGPGADLRRQLNHFAEALHQMQESQKEAVVGRPRRVRVRVVKHPPGYRRRRLARRLRRLAPWAVLAVLILAACWLVLEYVGHWPRP
jgi:hypothetical protein